MAVIKNINLLGIVVCCLVSGLHSRSSWRKFREEFPEDYERRDYSTYEDSYVEDKENVGDYSPYEDSYVKDIEDERAYEDIMQKMERRLPSRNDAFYRKSYTEKRDPRPFEADYFNDPTYRERNTEKKDPKFRYRYKKLLKPFVKPAAYQKPKKKCHPYCHQISTFAPDMCKNTLAQKECECICDYKFGPNPSPLRCGQKKDQVSFHFHKRVVGGSESKLGEWPWVVSVNATMINQTESNIWCAGTILSERFVLTARNPFDGSIVEMDPKYWSVTAGNLKLNQVGGQTSKVKKIILKSMEDYLYKNASGKLFVLLQKDIALLELETPLKFTENVRSLCLISEQNRELLDNCYVAGWGYKEFFGGLDLTRVSNEQQTVQLPTVSSSVCNAAYDDLIPTDILCAGWKEGGRDACFFDSGSPVACKGRYDDHWYVNGLVSTGYKCAQPDGYSFNTRVSLFTDWIIETILEL